MPWVQGLSVPLAPVSFVHEIGAPMYALVKSMRLVVPTSLASVVQVSHLGVLCWLTAFTLPVTVALGVKAP